MARPVRLFGFGKTAVSADASWLPVILLLVWTLADYVFPSLVPDLPPPHYWIMAIAGALGLFASIAIRESVQALIAARRGAPVGEITLVAFGGLPRDRNGTGAAASGFGQELALAAAALGTSLLLGAILLLALFKGAGEGTHLAPGGVAFFLGLANLGLAAVNLLPAFPMSGGRLLRAALLRRSATAARATRAAATAGVVVAAAFMAGGALMAFTGDRFGVYAGLWLIVAGLILAIAAIRERRAAR
jgi:Zn-dependent protease